MGLYFVIMHLVDFYLIDSPECRDSFASLQSFQSSIPRHNVDLVRSRIFTVRFLTVVPLQSILSMDLLDGISH